MTALINESQEVEINALVFKTATGGSQLVQEDKPLPVLSSENSDVFDITLSTDTLIYASGDVLADTQPVAGAVRVNGGVGIINSLTVIDTDNQGQPMDIVFLSANVSLGVENAAVSITDADVVNVLGVVSVSAADYINFVGSKVASVTIPATIPAKAPVGSTSIYVAAISRGTGTYTASGLKLRIGIVRI